jgi:hypothetical protein
MMAGRAEKQGLFGLGARKTEAREPPAAAVPAPARAAKPAPPPPRTLEDHEVLRLNIKALAGAAAHAPIRYADKQTAALEPVGVVSRAPLIADSTRPSYAYWCEALHCFIRPHRKLWEFSQVLQVFYEHGVLVPGAKVLGFGVGDEPIPSYLASLGLQVVATDLHGITDPETVLRTDLIDAADFDRLVEVSDVDITRTDDPTLREFDGMWSCSVINELANVDAAAEAVIDAMDTLKPGGVAVHTTEFAFADDILEQKPEELRFPRKFFESLTDGLNGRGHKVAPLSFDLGPHPLDAYIDLEPYVPTGAKAFETLWREGLGAPHFKVLSGGIPTTSFALVVTRRP